LRRDVLPDPGNDVRAPVLQEVGPNAGLRLAEAVTQESSTAGLLLPDGHTDVVDTKPIAGVAEVHGLADWIGAEAVVCQLNSSQGYVREQRLDRLELNW